MSIANRLTLFVLIYLGAVLLGFSVSLYGVTRWMLLAKLDRQLETAMHALVAAIEVHPDDVEWEPLERRLPLETDADLSGLRWTMRDERGTLIDASQDASTGQILAIPYADSNWRILVKRLRAGTFEPEPVTVERVSVSEETLPENRSAVRQSFLITVGLNERPVRDALRSLALAMGGVSMVIWLIAGIVGRGIGRRVLRPLSLMAEEARSLRDHPECDRGLQIPLTQDEVAELGGAYNELLMSLRLALERQRRFTGDASHQLRTPLAAILAAVDVTLRYERSSEEYIQALTAVQRRGRDLQQIVEALLIIARWEPSAALPGRESIDLGAWCQTRLVLWRDHERYADFRPDWSDSAARIDVQPMLLGQVFDNLLDNACKYSPPGSPLVVRTESDAREARLTIVDRGSGLTPAELQQIFEPFYRSNGATDQGISGTGLGLTIAKRMVTVMGGRLDATSEPGVGSAFCVILPRLAADPPRESVTVEPVAAARDLNGRSD